MYAPGEGGGGERGGGGAKGVAIHVEMWKIFQAPAKLLHIPGVSVVFCRLHPPLPPQLSNTFSRRKKKIRSLCMGYYYFRSKLPPGPNPNNTQNTSIIPRSRGLSNAISAAFSAISPSEDSRANRKVTGQKKKTADSCEHEIKGWIKYNSPFHNAILRNRVLLLRKRKR